MTTELDKARAALAEADSFAASVASDADPDGTVFPREDLARAVGVGRDHLRVVLTEVDRLTAALAEAEATIANERGEGEPPDPRFAWRPGQGYVPQWWAENLRWQDGWAVVVTRCLPARWTFDGGRTSHPTARACMRAAVTALKETP